MSSEADSDLDNLILSLTGRNWQKVAMVIAKALSVSDDEGNQTSAEELGARVEALVEDGRLEAQGRLSDWRHSEVRSP